MQKYPLNSLLQVREFREDVAKRQYVKARQEMEAAEVALSEAQNALIDYREWRVLEETRRYDAIMGKQCTKKDFDELKNGIALLLVHELELEENMQKAVMILQEKEKLFQESKEHFTQMQKDKEKILEHKELWHEDVLREELMLEDRELEEFMPKQKHLA